jgi:hypothetical protein
VVKNPFYSELIKLKETGMERLEFLKLMLQVPFAGYWLSKRLQSNGTGRRYLMNRFYVAGFQYYEGPPLISDIKRGEKLHLKADPQNVYDRFAVAVYRRGIMLGYVPRSDNKQHQPAAAAGPFTALHSS